ncbi:glycoside hydrolase family 31 protein [Lepidopterella palustris CBS 459.81]|uniref:alpha-glucosidase n=1 Tax=Lepidopterella palustris CBS 459.81 TaxID=1314670 RepID=A0A8E2JG18_9PEZI|nr:glycoside hydrolase family 31 protein [Lepidopterella palustris CBS 459.81]
MPQREFVPQVFKANTSRNNSSDVAVYLRSEEQGNVFNFSFEAIRPNLFRTCFTSEKHPLTPHPSTLRVESQLLKNQFSQPITCSKKIQVGNVTAIVEWTRSPIVSLSYDGSDVPFHQDLPFRSYAVDGSGVSHYTKYKKHTLHVGLGEKAAPMNLSNRHFVLSATDCFGYDVYRTDPMYKHIPLLINATPEVCVGIFSTSHSRGFYSVGSEMDGLWGPFKVYRQDHGGLEEYLIVGRTLKDIVRTYADLVGYPLLVPRWAFGYIAGGMKYSMLDEPRACDALINFAEKLKEHDIPCSAFQLSSGYTVAETEPKTRNVFTWNRHRFPDPKAFIDEYHRRGIRLIANVKPYVLANHPEYDKLVKARALFTDPQTNASATARLWSAGGGESGIGGHIDFTSAAGFQWWYEGARELKKLGIDSIWNDNNEYTIDNDDWQCSLSEASVLKASKLQYLKNIGFWGRSLQTELMAKSSYDATLEVEPDKRPFVLTRSATAGTMRYCASSWSGDNVTSWDGMKGANALSLAAGMCLLQCFGHDIGGFEGPQPTPELLVRWIQLGIYSSRFAINCFKTSPDDNSVGDVIEPWMYPEVTPLIRKAIKRRYELLPYIYSLAIESHMTASPPQRWTGWGYESDPEVWRSRVLTDGETQYWFGDALLISGVYEPGASTTRVYLPKRADEPDSGYLNLNAPYEYFAAGQWLEVELKGDTNIPVIAKVGTAVPLGKNCQTLSPGESEHPAKLAPDDYRAVEIFPPPGSSKGRTYTTTWFEDDGVSPGLGTLIRCTITYGCTNEAIDVRFQEDLKSGFVPRWEKLEIVLPAGDTRKTYRGQAAAQWPEDRSRPL